MSDAAHVDEGALAQALADLEPSGADGMAVEAAIERVMHNAATVFAGSGVGLMLVAENGHSLQYVASSDAVARRLERAHEDSGEGPCIDAFVLDACVKANDLHYELRWPALRAALGDEPIRAVLGLPTRLGAPVGTLNVYSERPRVWDASEVTALEAYNHLLEARLGEAVQKRRHGRVVEQLQCALDSRATIERAIGVMMGRDAVDGATAFDRLRREARSSRRRVRAVAEELLDGHPREAV
jgi:GAF domain-containing protein